MSLKPVLIISFAEETLPLVLALIAFAGFVLILVVVLLSIWKTGQLLRYSCCPAVVLPDTLVRVSRFPFSVMLTRRSLGSVGCGHTVSWLTGTCARRAEGHAQDFTSN